ncbi:hypothetical protein SETIT_1G072500v2 [Setaria italica]|uniref:Uncharacterized protein n=1 Tax=Setaria italica TaxID=4555 RepID=A0A368PHN8_SETIT|nr:hypothetical protein SETIT_1G072500v2 [Setaria italica]
MGIGGQITAILKLEYPSIVKDGPKKTFYAKTWDHYSITRYEDGMTAADHFRESIYSVSEEDRLHAEEVLERFATKQCKNMMYELRVSAVKAYYDDFLDRRINDKVARKEVLRETQYLKKYGPEAATDINNYYCMKSGVKNCDSNGKSGPIPTEKAQRRVNDYFATLEALHPNDFEQRKNDGKLDADALYQSSGNGLAHGRVPIANGTVRISDMKASARASNGTRQSNSGSYQYLDLFAKMNMPVPEDIVSQSSSEAENGAGSGTLGNRACGNGNDASGNSIGASGNGNDASNNGNDDNEDDPTLE